MQCLKSLHDVGVGGRLVRLIKAYKESGEKGKLEAM